VAVAAVQVAGGCALARWTPAGAGLLAPAVPLDASLPPNAGPPLGWAVWSNKAAAAYHDPCIPDPVGPYFVSVPVTSDQVQVTLRPYAGKMDVTSKGVLVPVGTKKTVDVQLLSDGPTSGPWTVSTQLIDQADFKFSFDRTTGQNGDVLHLTITAPSTQEQGTVALYSTLEGRRTFYVFPVQSR
jgi:hypothetical protein